MLDKVVTAVNCIIPLKMGQQLFADPVFILRLMCICMDKVKDIKTALPYETSVRCPCALLFFSS